MKTRQNVARAATTLTHAPTRISPLARTTLLTLALCVLTACGNKEPVLLGYVGGVTGRTADLGIGGRNGVQFAVEQANAQGGINGRKIELLLKDDESSPEKGKQVVKELIDAKVQAIIGPMTSNVAISTVPLINEAGVLMMSPTVTSNDLNGKDDHFFRVVAASAYHASGMSQFLIEKRKVRQINVVIEMNNKAYSESWLAGFEKSFIANGGKINKVVRYNSAADLDFSVPAAALQEAQPEAIVLVTSAVDATMLINLMRKQQVSVPLITTEWAGTGKLIELGGANVEGVFSPQYLDHQSTLPGYVAFRDAYRQRFNQAPGFPAIGGFNAAQTIITALRQSSGKETIKQSLLKIRRFEGLQETLTFDDFGDIQNKTFFTVIQNGQYIPVP